MAFSLPDTPTELRREPAFLLYTADFSRIQRFIYTVHTEGALRSLRSRSFFLELLMEHYMDELLDGCGLTRTNIIYSGGGHCYLLLPNTAAVQQTLADWNRAFNGWLNEQFGVQLFLANGWTPCSANDLCNVPAEASPYKATPRQIERVVAGSRFGVNIVYNLSDPKETEEDLSLLSKAMKLLQLDYLGGHGAPLQMEPLGSHSVENSLQLLLAAREEPASRTRLWFRTPCAFKQAGRYAIYPQEFLLLQSLVLHWNTAFPDCQLNDPDALDAILRGLHILDYNLHTVSYPIKNTRIPGFVGSAVVEARLGPAAAGALERPALLCALRRHRDQNYPWHGRRIGGAAGSAAEVSVSAGAHTFHAAALFKSRCSCSMHPCRRSCRVGPSH